MIPDTELQSLLQNEMQEHLVVMQKLRQDGMNWVIQRAKQIYSCLQDGKKILVAGNGGSAADAQHFSAELMGRFTIERRAFPAIALTTDTSAITAIANDYQFDHIFSRQLEGLGQPGDILVAISTSGNSPNLVKAIVSAKRKGIPSIALLGKTGGTMAKLADEKLIVPSETTQRIQEAHEWILHSWCALLDMYVGHEETK